MATPTLRSLRSAFPGAHITGIMRPVVAELLECSPPAARSRWFDGTCLFEKKLPQRLALIASLRRLRLDAVVLLTNSFWSAAVAAMAGARRIVGYDRDARGWLLTDRLAVLRNAAGAIPISPVDYYLRLADWLGGWTSNRSMELAASPHDQRLADALWEKAQFSHAIPTLVINSNSATDSDRVWPAERVLELSCRVAREFDWQVLLHCGPGERDIANSIAKRADHPRVASMGVLESLPIGLSKAVLGRASLVVSSDSGPRHIAVAQNRPVITLFGATQPAWTQTYNIPEISIVASDAAHSAQRTRRMQNIRVEDVLSEFRRFASQRCLVA